MSSIIDFLFTLLPPQENITEAQLRFLTEKNSFTENLGNEELRKVLFAPERRGFKTNSVDERKVVNLYMFLLNHKRFTSLFLECPCLNEVLIELKKRMDLILMIHSYKAVGSSDIYTNLSDKIQFWKYVKFLTELEK
jgi:hypothetical protein